LNTLTSIETIFVEGSSNFDKNAKNNICEIARKYQKNYVFMAKNCFQKLIILIRDDMRIFWKIKKILLLMNFKENAYKN
jgi:ABC-type uncharacterized transport system ATPase subunit